MYVENQVFCWVLACTCTMILTGLAGTSLAMVPSGRHLVAGFTDGTLRLFDLTGKFQSNDSFAPSISNEDYNLFDSDSSDDEGFDDDCTLKTTSTGSSSAMVCSKSHQRYGAVLAQIHAKGVHTSLQMTVAVSPDGVYAFGGVARGSMELVAVDLSQIELHLDTDSCEGLDFLDLAQVHRFADAKLRGFGACTRLQTYSNEPTYILLTGKGIKNIHIWSFQPSLDKWQCLYDTQSNGNSISTLHLRYSPSGSLQAISKSDSQKLRVWDLSHEQSAQDEERPKRPPYVDMSGTEAILGIGGDFGFAGCLYQQISLVNLNVDAPYNVTELELPHRGRISGRQQRGQMQSLQQVAGMSMDASHVLLEMSDFSVVHFYFEGNVPKLETLLGGGDSRTLCVARIGSSGITVAAMASGGSIVLRQIGDASLEGYWGFHGLSSKQKDMPSPCADSEAIAQAAGSSVNLFAGNSNKRPVYTSLALEDNTVPTTPDKTPDATARTSNVVPLSDKIPAATQKSNGVPLSAKTSATVPASAVKALGSNGVSLKARATPETKKPAGVAVSPETADEESTKKKKKKKKKADVREDDNKENKLERKKLVLHIRVSKESEPLDKKEEATATIAPRELHPTSSADSSMKSRSNLKKKKGALPKRPSTEPSKSEPSDKKEEATATVAPRELHPTSTADSSMKSKSNLKKKNGVSPKRPSTEPSKSEPSDKKEDATTTVAPTELHSISTTDSSMESRSIPKKREEFLPKKSAAEPSKSEEPRDKKEEATTTVALPEIHSTSSAESSMKSRSKKEDAMTTVAPPELDSTSTADSSMESRSIPKKRKEFLPKRPAAEPSISEEPSDKKEEVKTTVAPPELHSTSSPDSSTKSRSNPKKRRGVSPRRPVAERAQPFKKSRAVIEANLGNLNAVTLPPADGWKLPSMSVSRRFGSFKASETEVLRIKLVLEHRASHETLRKKVLESVPQLMRSANQEDPPSVEELKDSLEDVIVRYTEILVSTIDIHTNCNVEGATSPINFYRRTSFSGRKWKRQLWQPLCSCRRRLWFLSLSLKCLTRPERPCHSFSILERRASNVLSYLSRYSQEGELAMCLVATIKSLAFFRPCLSVCVCRNGSCETVCHLQVCKLR